MNEREIINQAIDRLFQHTGIHARWKPGPANLDGKLALDLNGQQITFFIETKFELRQHQLPQIQKLANEHQPFMLVTYRLFPSVKEQLKQLNIPYLDGAGNIFINTQGIFIMVDGNKPPEWQQKPTANRAFTRKGLETVFYFLVHPNEINAPHRHIAAQTGTALGNITNVIKGLEETGFILNVDKKNIRLQNKKELLNRWITGYEQTLKPALYLGRFFLYNNDWHALNPIADTVWGGEPAAEKMTGYLTPQQLTVYTKQARAQLIRNWKLIPDENGTLLIYEKFWNNTDQNLAPPLLVYADLLLTNDPRCIETAQKIYDKYLQHELE